jgi:peptidoglycan/xylan/chitin deacetylase (PgdA/CDA1 family)
MFSVEPSRLNTIIRYANDVSFHAKTEPVSMSGLKSSLKSAVFRGLHASHVTQLIAAAVRAKGVILTFHEIHDDLDRELWTGCPTPLLEKCIYWLRTAGWDIVTLKEALGRLHSDARTPRFAVFTFDDGYRDNIVRALPILRREQVPFTMYIPTGAITRELFAWWLGLREIFRNNEKVEIAALGASFFCLDLPSKRRSFATTILWALRNFERISEFRHTFAQYGISLPSLCDRYFINEDELRSLARDPLAMIGAHTVTHQALATLDAADVSRELVDNRAYLQACLDRDVTHFAYPFGTPLACGQREAKLVADAGFKTAVTTSNRPMFAQDCHDLYRLPRVSVHPNWTLAHVDAGVSGLTMATLRRFFA